MVNQHFIRVNHSLMEIIEFCEKEETTKQMLSDHAKQSNGNGNQQSKCSAAKSGSNASNANDKSSQGGKRKQHDTIVSYEESGGTNGCMIHTTSIDHTTNKCRVLKKQVTKLKQSWDECDKQQQPQKCQKTNNSNTQKGGNPNKSGGDLHTLMEQVKRVKKSLEKALKKQKTKNKKQNQENASIKKNA